MTEDHDPFMPVVPLQHEYGRLFTHRALVAGWPCRICLTPLSATPAGGLLCLNCDPLEKTEDA